MDTIIIVIAILLFLFFAWLIGSLFSAIVSAFSQLLGSGKSDKTGEVEKKVHDRTLSQAEKKTIEADKSSILKMLKDVIKKEEEKSGCFKFIIYQDVLNEIAEELLEDLKLYGTFDLDRETLGSAIDDVELKREKKKEIVNGCLDKFSIPDNVKQIVGCVAYQVILEEEPIYKGSISDALWVLSDDELDKLAKHGFLRKDVQVEPVSVALSYFKVPELKGLALEKEIDLTGAKRKDEIIKKIFEAGVVSEDDLVERKPELRRITLEPTEKFISATLCIKKGVDACVKQVNESFGIMVDYYNNVGCKDGKY